MRYEYTLTYQNFKDAQKLYRRYRWKAALSYYVWIWFIPITGFLVGLPFVASLFGFRLGWLTPLAGFGAVGLWVAFCIPVMRFFQIRNLWKRIVPEGTRKSIKTTIPVALEFNDEQLISILPGRSEGRFFWPAIIDFAEDEKLALLFIKKKNFLFIPRQALPEAAWVEIRMRMANNLASKRVAS